MSPLHRYFFCLQPPVTVARRIGLLRDGLERGGRIVADRRLHVTLAITDDYQRSAPDVAELMIGIGGAIDAEPFHLSLDRVSAGRATIALRPSRAPTPLGLLQRQLDQRMAFADIRRADWAFNPHMTLLYWQGQPFLRPVPPFEWEATELVLIHSLVGATEHRAIGRWPLVRRQELLAF